MSINLPPVIEMVRNELKEMKELKEELKRDILVLDSEKKRFVICIFLEFKSSIILRANK